MENQITNSILKSLSANFKERVAVRYQEEGQEEWKEISGNEIHRMIVNISKTLINHGVEKGDKVAIFSQNRYEWTLVDIAIMRIGAITVPIYATNTANQAKYIIDDAQIKLLFAGSTEQVEKTLEIYEESPTLKNIVCFSEKIQATDSKFICFKSFLEDNNNQDLDKKYRERVEQVQPDDLATLIYTSGTTGEPKGVMLANSNLLASFRIHDIRLTNLTDQDTSLSFLPLSHVFERIWTLYCLHKGIQVSFLDDPKKILETLAVVKPTVLCTVPRVYEKYYNAVQNQLKNSSKSKVAVFNWAVKIGKKYHEALRLEKPVSYLLRQKMRLAEKLVLDKLKAVLGGNLRMTPTGGAPLSKEIQEFMRAIGIPVTMGYGLTETCASVTAFTETQYEFGSSGKLMPEMAIKFGDKHEIMVKGPTVMKGYYNKPEETAAVFEGEWFKTGDVGEVDENGNLFITDRLKDLMKTAGGKYIAPQLIESILTDDTFIEQAMVIGDQKPYVTAFVVPNFEALKEYANSLELSFKNFEELISIPKIKEFYNEKIEEVQKELANFEKVKKIKLLPKEFSMERGELTPTLKIKRKVIIKKFKNFVDELYGGNSSK
jgi:long-chain acyl-CoA synthetase